MEKEEVEYEKYITLPEYYDDTKSELRGLLHEYGSDLSFEQNNWVIDTKKRNGESQNRYTLYFTESPEQYIEIIKYFCILRLMDHIAVNTISWNITIMDIFCKFLIEKYGAISLSKVNKYVIEEYKDYIFQAYSSMATRESYYGGVRTFFSTMDDWEGMPPSSIISRKNPYSRTLADRVITYKYPPKTVIYQLDKIFFNDRLPLEFRTAYWILRCIPSRIEEVCGIHIECLKPSFKESEWILFIPSWKQSGQNGVPELHRIYIKDNGFGAFLIGLIKQQQDIARKLQPTVKNKDILLIHNITNPYKKNSLHFDLYSYYKTKAVTTTSPERLAVFLEGICKRFNVVDENGKLYTLTSHQLRHVGITDRLWYGFEAYQVRDITGHKGGEMLTTYSHPLKDEMIKKQRAILGEPLSPVLFKGRILNMSEAQEFNLLRNPKAHRIGKLGICSDASVCKNGCNECLGCDCYIPNGELLSYFQSELERWKVTAEKCKNSQSAYENAIYNISLYENVIMKIEHSLKEVNS